jgi:hypothetical protein
MHDAQTKDDKEVVEGHMSAELLQHPSSSQRARYLWSVGKLVDGDVDVQVVPVFLSVR